MKDVGTRFATGLAAVGLTGVLLAVPGFAQSPPSTRSSTTTTTLAGKRAESCSAVRQRLADAPQILTRIEASIDRLNAQLDNARLPARRIVLEDRIERLEALRSELAQQIANARRSCATL